MSPTVTTIATGAYLRGQAVLTLESDYQTVSFFYNDNNVQHEGAISESAGFLNGSTAVTLQMPDFTAAGYNAIWGLRPGAQRWGSFGGNRRTTS